MYPHTSVQEDYVVTGQAHTQGCTTCVAGGRDMLGMQRRKGTPTLVAAAALSHTACLLLIIINWDIKLNRTKCRRGEKQAGGRGGATGACTARGWA